MAVEVALASVARRDAENARLMIPSLVQAQKTYRGTNAGAARYRCMATDGQRCDRMRKRNGAMTRLCARNRRRLSSGACVWRCMGDRRGLNTRLPDCHGRRKRKTSGVTGRRIYCWSAGRRRSERDPFMLNAEARFLSSMVARSV